VTAILLFDTLKFSKRLIEAGMPAAQAEELAEAQKEAFQESLNNGLASKEDITLLDKKLDKKIEKINKKLSTHDWMLRFLLALMLVMLGKMFF
jgi:hypothetical protein